MTEPAHPAKFSDKILEVIDELLGDAFKVLDPFAGVGRIHNLRPKRRTFGVEIEREWAATSRYTINANALALPWPTDTFDAIATSPCYGNRMADHHDAKDGSKRTTYRHVLGHELHESNSGQFQWGERYRLFHSRAWREAVRVLKPDGRFVLNISNHIRGGEEMLVTEFHITTLAALGLMPDEWEKIETPRLRHGANRDLRVDYESVILFRWDAMI